MSMLNKRAPTVTQDFTDDLFYYRTETFFSYYHFYDTREPVIPLSEDPIP